MKKVMFISSTGGHFNELMQLKPLFKKYDYHIVTEKDEVTKEYKQEYKDKISYLVLVGFLCVILGAGFVTNNLVMFKFLSIKAS